ncbi:MAG: hypothetical protein KBT75_03340 [Oleispira antarctica]|uniref:Lipoprotein n=1 Tax=Oleispira antarctica RB-8 TaxID=698738 RepID=R4YQ74_OLEAN|nr:hypothetical protein [Oleispira antarctica]MBQ0792031.1 hypothetical protein [Oleispira antarctica]CCK74289.1 Hypothetical protein OLEAN_C01130 [Oleispira antarctica RB-8]|tara:strand:- start:788 stop:982 length:195 start_codon:yes stop_codon:yes gene_type:complete
MQLLAQIKVQVLTISSWILMISLIGCASEPFVTDEESAAALQADRQNTEFQEKGVPSRPIDKNN